MKVCLVQPETVWEDRRANYDRIRDLLFGLDEEVDLLVLPEMCATGFSMDLGATVEGDEEETLEFLGEVAVDRDCHVIGGYVRPGSAPDKARNVLALVGPDREKVAEYTKLHPFTYGGEDKVYEPGSELCVVPVGEFRIGLFICYDLRFPEVFREAMAQGADAFVVPANWPVKRIDHFRSLLKARAIENLAYTIGVNRVGEGGGLPYNGNSVAFDPLGSVVADAGEEEGLVVAELDPAKLREHREKFGFLGDILTDRYPSFASGSRG